MPDSGKLMITRPNHDTLTFYLHEWSEEIIDFAESKGIDVIDLEGEDASKENFESYIESSNPSLIVFNGHGSDVEICGHDDKPLLKKDENEDKTEGKIFYARTCHAGGELGKICVREENAEAFIGYKEAFVLTRDPNLSANPKEDSFARPILNASNAVPNSLIKGKSARKAFEKSQKKYKEMMRKVTTNYTLGKQQVLSALAFNRMNQVIID